MDKLTFIRCLLKLPKRSKKDFAFGLMIAPDDKYIYTVDGSVVTLIKAPYSVSEGEVTIL